jgi:hypothetical protein
MANLPLDDKEESLTPEQEAALQESIDEIARGEYVTAAELLNELRAIRNQKFA